MCVVLCGHLHALPHFLTQFLIYPTETMALEVKVWDAQAHAEGHMTLPFQDQATPHPFPP